MTDCPTCGHAEGCDALLHLFRPATARAIRRRTSWRWRARRVDAHREYRRLVTDFTAILKEI